jgi:Glycosyltransferase sugar-binding region containing DXD motif.
MIPNIIHFCFGMAEDFGGKPFSIFHFIAVKSAYEINKPEEIFFYYKYEPEGEWWDAAKPYLTLVKIEPPHSFKGRPLKHFAHKSDVLRLLMLKEKGGIYLDMDTVCKKSFGDLLDYKFVIGKEGKYFPKKLCNAVMLSEKNSEFVNLWIEEYGSFRSTGNDRYWAEHSVKVPYRISKKHPALLHIESYTSFHYPLYHPSSLRKLFIKDNDYKEAYCHHLWENGSYEKYLKNLNKEYILNVSTTYNTIARKYL